MVSVVMLERLAQADDPKKALIEAVGDLSQVEVMANRVLLAIYIAPEKTKGGIIRSTGNMKEDIYQGTVGLVLKMGKQAFVDDEATKTYFHNQTVKVGDWVVFRPGDGKRMQLRQVDCRMIEDTLIDMVISDPEIITYR